MNRLTQYLHNSFYVVRPHSTNFNNNQKLGKIEDLLEKYEINNLAELEIALDYYYHRYDSVETRRIEK